MVFDGGNSCGVNFSTEIFAEADGLKLEVDHKSAGCNFLEGAVAWRPSPDGVSLLDQDGMTVILFSAENGVYRSEVFGETGAVLKRISSIN